MPRTPLGSSRPIERKTTSTGKSSIQISPSQGVSPSSSIKKKGSEVNPLASLPSVEQIIHPYLNLKYNISVATQKQQKIVQDFLKYRPDLVGYKSYLTDILMFLDEVGTGKNLTKLIEITKPMREELLKDYDLCDSDQLCILLMRMTMSNDENSPYYKVGTELEKLLENKQKTQWMSRNIK